MHRTQDNPMLCYKFRLPVVSQQWQLEGELDRSFIHDYGHEISDQWTLIDPMGNSHIVHYNMNTDRPRLTYGWHALRYFYHLEGDCVFMLDCVGESVFHIQIKEHERKEIRYSSFRDPANRVAGHIQAQYAEPPPAAIEEPGSPGLFNLGEQPVIPHEQGVSETAEVGNEDQDLDDNPEDMDIDPADVIPTFDDYQCVFTHVLNYDQAKGDSMRVPASFGEYLKAAAVDRWWFIGSSDVEIECEMIKLVNSNHVAIGQGWKNFCEVNYVLPLEEYTFKFTNPGPELFMFL